MRLPAGLIAALAVLVALAACETKPVPDRLTLARARFTDLPGWAADRPAAALTALRRSCDKLTRLGDDVPIGPDAVGGTARDWQAPCAAAAAVDGRDEAGARSYFERWFQPFLAGNNAHPEGLFTGYYEPELHGSRTRSGRYTVPLYGRPADLVTVDLGLFREDWRGTSIAGRVQSGALRPYPTRAEITGGALRAQKRNDGGPLELVWVDDALDAFFLEIQGSGRIVLDDGSLIRVGYAASNGQPYFAIGRELVTRGALTREDANMPAIRTWLAGHPQDAPTVMNKNASYVFFRALPPPASPDDGPPGAQGVALTPGRSLAVDRKFLPLGVPIFVDAEDPLIADVRLQRLFVAQDTGGAIRGPVRADVFWGHGAEAAERAGRMRSKGRYWIFLPLDVAQRRAATS
jgi:membrane-bound lytic murein transglycosylase A